MQSLKSVKQALKELGLSKDTLRNVVSELKTPKPIFHSKNLLNSIVSNLAKPGDQVIVLWSRADRQLRAYSPSSITAKRQSALRARDARLEKVRAA